MKTNFAAAAISLSLVAAPAFAQTTTGTTSTGTSTMGTTTMGATHATTAAPATGKVGDTTNTLPSQRNGVMTDAGQVRASKVIGSDVYNDHNEKLGSVNDLVIAKDGKLNAVLSVGGFLGMGEKYVEVPYSTLIFGNTQKDSDNKIVVKGATKDSLKAHAAYMFYKS